MTAQRLETIILTGMFLAAGLIGGWALDSTLHISAKIHEYRISSAQPACHTRMMLINPDAELDTCQISDDRR